MPDVVEPRAVTSGAHALFHLVDAAKIEHRQATRLGRRGTVSHPVRGGHIDKGLQLVTQILLSFVPMDEPPHDRRKAMY